MLERLRLARSHHRARSRRDARGRALHQPVARSRSPSPTAPAGYASIWEELRALNVSVSDGNCGALDAVACADMLLEHGRAEALLVGGAEAMSEALSSRSGSSARGPTARVRSARVRRCSRWSRSTQRGAAGAEVLAEVVGLRHGVRAAGARVVAHPRVAPRPWSAPSPTRSPTRAPRATDVDLVVSGVSGLRAFDEAELAAIGDGFRRPTPASSPPSVALGRDARRRRSDGHGCGAGVWMATSAAPHHVVRGAVRTVRAAAPQRAHSVTSLGFYGNASALVLRGPSRQGV